MNCYKALSAACALRPGRTVIVAEAGSFPTDLYIAESLARQHGWSNLPLTAHDVQVCWIREQAGAPGGVLLRRHLPSRRYTAMAPDFESLVSALAWEAHEWVAVEAWRARKKAVSPC